MATSVDLDPVEIAKDPEHHAKTVLEQMRYGGNLRGASPTGYQRPPTTYPRGAPRISMLQDDQYDESSESDSDGEFTSNHLQGFSKVAVNNMQRNDPRTVRNPDPAAVQSRRERNPPFQKSCHACGRFDHPAVQCDFLAKYAHILEYWKSRDPAEVKAAEE